MAYFAVNVKIKNVLTLPCISWQLLSKRSATSIM